MTPDELARYYRDLGVPDDLAAILVGQAAGTFTTDAIVLDEAPELDALSRSKAANLLARVATGDLDPQDAFDYLKGRR